MVGIVGRGDGEGLIGMEGLVGPEGGGLVGPEGGRLVGPEGGGLVGPEEGGLVGPGGGGLVGPEGGGLVGPEGGLLVGPEGGGLVGIDGEFGTEVLDAAVVDGEVGEVAGKVQAPMLIKNLLILLFFTLLHSDFVVDSVTGSGGVDNVGGIVGFAEVLAAVVGETVGAIDEDSSVEVAQLSSVGNLLWK